MTTPKINGQEMWGEQRDLVRLSKKGAIAKTYVGVLRIVITLDRVLMLR